MTFPDTLAQGARGVMDVSACLAACRPAGMHSGAAAFSNAGRSRRAGSRSFWLIEAGQAKHRQEEEQQQLRLIKNRSCIVAINVRRSRPRLKEKRPATLQEGRSIVARGAAG